MKRLIQICSLLTLVVAFSVVSANAQTIQRMEADIPFSFNIGSKTYDSGTYVMRISNATVGKVVTLENDRNHVLQSFFVMERGDAPEKTSYLRFVNDSNKMSLAKISTSEKSFALPGSPFNTKVTGKYKPSLESQSVSINLKLK